MSAGKNRPKPMIRTGDEVQVIRGKEAGRRTPPGGDADANPQGRRGRVRKVLASEGRVIVQGVRMVSKATRADPRKGHRGGFVKKEAPLPISSVMLVCRNCDRPVRARRVRGEDGKTTRVCRRCGEKV